MRSTWLVPIVLAGCVAHGLYPDEMSGEMPGGDTGRAVVEDVRCAGTPAAAAGAFRHLKNDVIAALGDPRHRGLDLVASPATATQLLEGWISYTVVDKALEDEDVDVFACSAGQWRAVGTARTDDEGHFALALSGDARLPLGMRDLFASVVGDRTGARFLGYVAREGSPVIVSDVDGTLTSSEYAFVETIVLGSQPDARAGAPQAYSGAAARGVPVVYLTARGNQFTSATRAWLRDKGFPRGPVRLSPSFVTLPGDDTAEFKARSLDALSAAGVDLAAGVGNRASDVAAYASAGLSADRIFIELPEYADEVQPLLDVGAATGFSSYDQIAGTLAKLP